jgi:cell division transport system permease protein
MKVSDKQAQGLATKLRKSTTIQQVDLITKQQALDEFKTYSGFGDALKAMHKNPLPAVLQVFPDASINDKASINAMLSSLKTNPEVDFAQMDMQWLERLQSIMQLAQRSVILISFLLGLAVLFITGNTIRLELQNRRDEVLIAKLVGATHAFIQRPFLYSGFWYGFAAGVLSWIIVTVMMLVLQKPIETLSSLYDGRFNIVFLSASDSLMLLIISSMLGVIGAWLVLMGQLQQIKPE